MKKSKIFAMVMAISTIFTMFGSVLAYDDSNYDTMLISANPIYDDSIKVLLNDEIIDFTDENGNVVEPQLINSRTMVPMRKIFEEFGATIAWDGETETVTATTAEKELVLQINNPEAKVRTGEDEETITLDSVPTVINGRTLVPVRFIAESLELKVGWDDASNTVIILDTDVIFEKIEQGAPTFYSFITSDLVPQVTAEAELKGNGTINYTNASDKTSNTNIKVALNGESKIGENAASVEYDLKITGKGSLLEAVKAEGFDKIDMSVVLDRATSQVYMKSSLLEVEYGNKWLKEAMTEEQILLLNNAYATSKEEKVNFKTAIEEALKETTVTPTTYYELDEMADILCQFVSDEYFTVSGRNSKTYTYKMSLEEILNTMGVAEAEKEEILNMCIAEFELSIKVENDTITDMALNLDAEIKDADETITAEIEMTTETDKINEKVDIDIPAEKDVLEL